MKNKKLLEYNSKIFDEMKEKYPLLQLGFFNSNDILFIGQNPGAPFDAETEQIEKEHTSNKSFEEYEKIYEENIKKCKLGKVLSKMIHDKYNKVSLTNVVKIPTAGNAIPDQQMIDTFSPILDKQVELLQPKLIVCLGRFAGKHFGLDNFFEFKEIKNTFAIMIYHPSYIRRLSNEESNNILLSINTILNTFFQNEYE